MDDHELLIRHTVRWAGSSPRVLDAELLETSLACAQP